MSEKGKKLSGWDRKKFENEKKKKLQQFLKRVPKVNSFFLPHGRKGITAEQKPTTSSTSAYHSVVTAGSIKLCHRSQPDFNDCVAKAIHGGIGEFVQGNRELGLPVLDPYFIERLEIPPAAGKSLSIHQIFTNINVIGMPNGKIKQLELNFDKGCGWTMETLAHMISFVGDYKINGNVLVFPINSEGKCNVSQIEVHNKHKMWCEKYQKNGKTFLRFTNYTMDMHPKRMIYDFTDVFPTNKEVEKEIAKTLNENGLALFNDVKGAFEHAFSMIYLQLGNKVFEKIPFDDIFLP